MMQNKKIERIAISCRFVFEHVDKMRSKLNKLNRKKDNNFYFFCTIEINAHQNRKYIEMNMK